MNKISGITDVFFDLDHTLWDFEKNSALTFEKIFKLNKIDVNLNDFLEHYVPINFKYWKLYREAHITKEVLRFERLDVTFKAINVSLQKDVIHKLSVDYVKYLSTFNFLIEGTIDILEYLKGSYRLHIITNGFDEVQHKKMAQSNIINYFETTTNAELAGVKKPNSKIFDYALHLANTKANKSIMIGDSLEADVDGALKMGMDAIFYNPDNSNFDKGINSISKLIDIKHYL
jgi:putative hydrolase of the HAD superfamily